MRAACPDLRHRPTVPMPRSAVFVQHVVIAVVILLHAIWCVSCQSATRANRHHSTTVSVITSLTAVPTHSKNNAQPCAAAAAGASDLQFDDVASRTVKAPIVLEGRIVRTLRPSTSGADTSPVTNAVYAVTRVLKGKLAAEVPKSNATVIIGPFAASVAGRSKSGDRCDVKLPTLPPLSSPQQQQQLFIAFASQLVPSDPQSDSNIGSTGVVGDETQPFYRISGQLVAATKHVVKEVQSHSCAQCGQYTCVSNDGITK